MDQDELAQLLLATFLEELQEHVANINRELMTLEKCDTEEARRDSFDILFRAAHTLKGSSRAVNAAPIEAACHQFEEVLTAGRDGRIELDNRVFSVLFATADALEEAGMNLREDQALSGSSLNDLARQLAAIAASEAETAQQSAASDSTVDRSGSTEPIDLECERSVADSAGDEAADPSQETRVAATPSASAADSAAVSMGVHERDTRTEAPPSSDAARRPVAATVRVAAEKLDSLLAKSGELLIARQRVASRAGEIAELCDLVTSWKREWASVDKILRQHKLLDQTPSIENRAGLPRRAVSLLEGSYRHWVQFEKQLDRLMDTMQADSRYLDTACRALDGDVHQARMLPFAEACRGLERAARDIAAKCGKQVQLRLQGQEVEIDRSVLEGLKDPLLHLVRNAVDHGLEDVAEREDAGKDATGKVTIGAALRGNEVEVVVADDGRGIRLDRIRERAKRKGLSCSGDDAALLRLLFHPGFSTASMVTDISGRGVGLDVVQSMVETLHGTVRIAFEPGAGTQFIIRVPLTLTTIRAVLVEYAGQVFGIATSCVQQLVRVTRDQFQPLGGHPALLLGGQPIPAKSLGDAVGCSAGEPSRLGPPGPRDDKVLVLVIRVGDERAAMLVDQVLSEQEVVVQSLGPRIRRVRHVSGAALLPTGQIALVLNAANVIRSALAKPATLQRPSELAPQAAEARRLLVVDDSLTTRILVKSILETAGYEVEVAVDGAAAWKQIKEDPPELVVSDVDMPHLDGFQLTETIRECRELADLPVILVTARQTDEDRARGVRVGANAYMTKSAFDQHSLLETIEQLL